MQLENWLINKEENQYVSFSLSLLLCERGGEMEMIFMFSNNLKQKVKE